MRRAYTLIEMLVSLATVAVIAGATMSVMVVASRAMPHPGDAADRSAKARAALDTLAMDLRLATAVLDAGTDRLELTVPDITGDGAADNVRYDWGGKVDGPLVRVVNGAETNLLEEVREFSVTWTTRSDRAPGGGGTALGSEVLLAAYDDAGSTNNALSLGRAYGQYVLPVLPGNATTVAITRATVRVQRTALLASVVNASLLPDASGVPGATPLATTTFTVSGAKNSTLAYAISFPTQPEVAAGSGVWLSVQSALGLGDNLITMSPVADSRQGFATSTNSGSSWTASPDTSMRFSLYGKVRTPQDRTITRADAARVGLVLTADPSTRHVGGAVLENSPPVTSAPVLEIPAAPLIDLSGLLRSLLGVAGAIGGGA